METRTGRKIAIKILHPKNYLDSQEDASDKMIDEIYDAMTKSMLDEAKLLKVRDAQLQKTRSGPRGTHIRGRPGVA